MRMSFIAGIILVSTVTIVALCWKEIILFFYKKQKDTD